MLEDWIDSPPFSAAMLHNKVLSVLKHERPERIQSGKRRKMECRRTPIHIVATADPRLPSIELGRRPAIAELATMNEKPPCTMAQVNISDKAPVVGEGSGSPLKRKEYHPESLNDLVGNDYRVPRVIISLALDENQTLSSKMCQKWLASCPTLVKFATVEAVFKSFSTLVLLSIPVLIWDLLPEDPACVFVGYATSPNMLGHDACLDSRKPTEVTEATEEMHAKFKDLCRSTPRNPGEWNVLDATPPDPPPSLGLSPGEDEFQSSVEGHFQSNTQAYDRSILQKLGSRSELKDEALPSLPPAKPEFQSSVHDRFRSNIQSYDTSLLQKLDTQKGKALDAFGNSALEPQINNASIKDPTAAFRKNTAFKMSPEFLRVFDGGTKDVEVLWNKSEGASIPISISQKQCVMKKAILEYLENCHAWSPAYLNEIIYEYENVECQIKELPPTVDPFSLDCNVYSLDREHKIIKYMILLLGQKYSLQASIFCADSDAHKQDMSEEPAGSRGSSSQGHEGEEGDQSVTTGQHQRAKQNQEA